MIALAFGVLAALAAAGAWSTRYALADGMMVLAPFPNGRPATSPHDVAAAVEITRAGATIRSWVFEPTTVAPARSTILLLHGIGDSKLNLIDAARSHAARGHRVVTVDSRGHGESSGRFRTYGVEEARDLHALVDELARRGLLARRLSVVGTSYGAATALQFAAIDPRVERVVALASFASLREVVPAYLVWILGSPARLIPHALVDDLVDHAARDAGFSPDAACPRCTAPRIRASVLLIHSRDDERIPWRQSVEIRAALGPRAQLMLVDGVDHVHVGNAPGVAQATERWLDAEP